MFACSNGGSAIETDGLAVTAGRDSSGLIRVWFRGI